MQFTKLKLTGFKSFVDPTELWIEPGLTGVVGPNGCGKSNLVEAIRWVMGETSAKQMRGGGMAKKGFAKGGADVELIDHGDKTILRYSAKAETGGKIAQLGARLIESTAKKLAKKFFGNFEEIMLA